LEIINHLNSLNVKGMRLLILIFVVLGITTFNSCKKETVVATPILTEEEVVADATAEEAYTVWMYYDETICADPWGGAHTNSEEEKKTNIENYFIDLEVEIFEIEISDEGLPESNLICVSKSGNVIKCRILLEGVNVLINEEFYQ
jgi:hypothetical protein